MHTLLEHSNRHGTWETSAPLVRLPGTSLNEH